MNNLGKAVFNELHIIYEFTLYLFAFSSVKLWASAFGGEMKSISAKYSGSQLLQKVSIKDSNGNFNIPTLFLMCATPH